MIFWLSSPDSAIGTWKSPVLLIQGDYDRADEATAAFFDKTLLRRSP